jgi:hypothetical protein
MPITNETKLLIIGFAETGMGVKKIRTKLAAREINHSLHGILNVIQNWRNHHILTRKVGSGKRISNTRIQSRNLVKDLLDPPREETKPLSLRQVSARLHLKYSTTQRIARRDLNLKVFKKKKRVHAISEESRVKRLNKCRNLLNKIGPRKLNKVMFTDEKLFVVNGPLNSQNSRIWTTARRKKRNSCISLTF